MKKILYPMLIIFILIPLGLISENPAWAEWDNEYYQEALGFIPKDWEVLRGKFLFHEINERSENGDELLLYFLERGDTCAMTLTCCMGQSKSRIRAIAETDGAMLMIPVEKMEEWLTKYKTWRNFVFDSYNVRLNEMLEAIDTLAFMNLDERLYKYLTDKAKVIGDTEIKNTHQEIAYEMHTSRVVISRLLKALELQGKIKLHRNKIEILQF